MIRPDGAAHFAQVIPLHAPSKPVIEVPVLVARHRGRCGGEFCRQPIRPGEEIQRVGGIWLHAECVPHDAVEGFEHREAA